MTDLVVKLNPYNAPFKPASEPGVYWLDQQYAGDCLHDSHVMAYRVAKFRRAGSILTDCGLPHLAEKGTARTHFIPNAEFMADLSRDGVKAVRRYLKNQGQK